ncbi:hypothetical protein GS909_18625 [Rhodococcus hoagii]|nr:hypothetical protein [Prescottella equi]
MIKPAQDQGVIFSAQASLYNLYVYFWRWAIWKVFEQLEQERAIVSFITASSWLDGPAFVGLRQLAVDVASDIWILDLGGEGRARGQKTTSSTSSLPSRSSPWSAVASQEPGTVHYRRLRGTRPEKFKQLDAITHLDATDGWTQLNVKNGEPFVPATQTNSGSVIPHSQTFSPGNSPESSTTGCGR